MPYYSGRKGTIPDGGVAALDNNQEVVQLPAGASAEVTAGNPNYVKKADGSWGTSGGASGAPGSGDAIFYENGQVVTANYSIPVGTNAMSTGPITVNVGVVVQVPNGSKWVVL